MTNIVISSANKKDIPQIIDCARSSLPIYYSHVQLENFLGLKDHKILIIKVVNQLAGFMIFKIDNQNKLKTDKKENNIHILSVAIYNNIRSKGIGTFFFNYLKSTFKKYTITLYVQTSNFVAVNFYFKQYFKIISYNPNYYATLSDKGCYYMKYLP